MEHHIVLEEFESAVLIEILVEEGESVEKGSLLCLLETDKAIMEVEAPFAGIVHWQNKTGDIIYNGNSFAVIKVQENPQVAEKFDFRGSTWKKWDLHFHTPSSHDYQYKGATNQEIIDGLVDCGVDVVAITDHHLMDVDRIKELQALGKDKVTVLPGIEFRSELGGSESIHFIGIFSENSDISNIWMELQVGCKISPKEVTAKGGDEKIYCDLKETAQLIHKLGGLVSIHAGSKTNTVENITNSLSHKMAMKTDLVLDHIDIYELGQVKDQKGYRDVVFKAIDKTLPMIICSDNHDIRKYAVKENLWIKAEPTFEGLRQILYEPQHRVFIGSHAPIPPPIRINKVKLDFPANSSFEGEVFCLSGKKEIPLSPNFTCIIGGRGTGKSTFLNLIHEKLRQGENQFFKNRKILNEQGETCSVEEHVDIDNDADEKYIEFLSQNEVEDFAKDYHKLTQAVYSRMLKRDSEGLLKTKEKQLVDDLVLFRKHIVNVYRIETLRTELEQKKKELGTHKRLVDSFSSTEYKEINGELRRIGAELIALKSASSDYNELLKELSALQQKFQRENPANQYEAEIVEILTGISKLTTESEKTNFQESDLRMEALTTELGIKKQELEDYLSGKGLTEENLMDISNANTMINELEQEIEERTAVIEELKKNIEAFDTAIIESSSADYKSEIEAQVKNISDILENLKDTLVKLKI